MAGLPQSSYMPDQQSAAQQQVGMSTQAKRFLLHEKMEACVGRFEMRNQNMDLPSLFGLSDRRTPAVPLSLDVEGSEVTGSAITTSHSSCVVCSFAWAGAHEACN